MAGVRYRLPFMALAALGLALGLWAGLARLGWVIPPAAPHHPLAHGPLMVGGFLGALIGLERAVALGRWWGYLVPVLAGASTLWTAARPDFRPAAWLLSAAGLVACCVFVRMLGRRDDLATRVMALAVVAWFLGNVQWALTGLLLIAVPWWGAFLVLTILGERLELARVLEPPPRAKTAFVACLVLLLGGLLAAYAHHGLGLRAFGAGLVAFAAWGLRWDLARRTLNLSSASSARRSSAKHRFTAVAILGGYVWLAVSGAFMLIWGERLGGLPWDASLHALFLGFVFSMIFAHAPLVAGMVLGRQLAYSPAFYIHLVLLHLSLALRVGADLAGSTDGRALGALLNMVAIAVFLLNTVRAALMGADEPEQAA
ncbi:MAG: hypothetical protein GY719_11165 [bacterium]|nr:hypothetical protein [bacterium]